MDCPRCKLPLTKHAINEGDFMVIVDQCEQCGGMWFDKGEMQRIEMIIEPTVLEIRHIPNKDEQLQVLNCPYCGDFHSLKKAEHFRDRRVIIDYCTKCHGVWLDHGELEAIQQENFIITMVRFFRWVIGKV